MERNRPRIGDILKRMGRLLNFAPRSPLDVFLASENLDDLGKARQRIAGLTHKEADRLRTILERWNDHQAIANLLFHPAIIPEDVRVQTLDRALHTTVPGYFRLAATVGLQRVNPDALPEQERARFAHTLINFLGSPPPVLAARASTTLSEWTRVDDSDDLLTNILAVFPGLGESVRRNIIAVVLEKYKGLSADDFDTRVSHWDLPDSTRETLRAAHREYREMIESGGRGLGRFSALFSYIPSFSEFR